MSDESIKLTGTTLTVIALHVDRLSSSLLFDQLAEKVDQAPQFFYQSPIVIDLGDIHPDNIAIDLSALITHCRNIGLRPMAYKNVHEAMEVQQLALPVLASSSKDIQLEQPEKETIVTQTVTEERLISRPSKVITRPVRSGQQVYAEGTDLIVLAQVSEGSEVIADGNIHVYGALRGRALAGVKGDTNARIFCRQMSAELLAIAGNFLLSDSLDESLKNQAVQVSLDGERLITTLLT